MRKYIELAIIVLCVSLYMYLTHEPEDFSPPPKNILRIGVECDYVPNSWEESAATKSNVPIANLEGSYAEGYDIQIAKLVAAELGFVLEVRKIAWNDLLPALINGEIDAIFSSMLDTEERRKIADFSDPYEVNKAEYGIMVDSVSHYITAGKLEDFRGARIIGERGTKLDEVIDQIPGVIHLPPKDKIQAMIDAVLNEEADGAVIDTDTGHFYEVMNKNLTLIKFSEEAGFRLGFHGVCAGVRKDDTELLHKINIALNNIPRSERKKIMDTATSRMMTNL
ncbi:MAG: transporter substrate-binding domain-containing protein [Synergistaceae bacterium]|nr:transporter substrate-binding domain-containing protein [Synergistaceae bacterium]